MTIIETIFETFFETIIEIVIETSIETIIETYSTKIVTPLLYISLLIPFQEAWNIQIIMLRYEAVEHLIIGI